MKRRLGYALIFAFAAVAAVSCRLMSGREEPCGSGAIDRGNGWHEIGGPTAFLLYEPPYFGPAQGRKAFVRIAAPTAGRPLTVEVHERGGSGIGRGVIQPEGWPMSAFDPTGRPTSDLPGRIYLFVLDIPSTGCWTLDFKLGDERAGSAAIPVVPLPTDQAPDG